MNAPSNSKSSSKSPPTSALEALFQQILRNGAAEHLASYYQRRRLPDESLLAFLGRVYAFRPSSLAVLKLVAKEFILLEAARPLLARDRFADELTYFLQTAEPEWQPPSSVETRDGMHGRPAPQPDSADSILRSYRTSWVEEDYDALSDEQRLEPPASPPTVVHADPADSSLRSYRASWAEEDYDALSDERLDATPPAPPAVHFPEAPSLAGADAGSTCVPGDVAEQPTIRRGIEDKTDSSVGPLRSDAGQGGGGFLPPGTRMGKYTIQAMIGQGAFGTVYSSTHPALRVPVAIKVMRSTITHGDDQARFISEARLVAQLNHPAVVRVWDFDEDELGRPYLVLEYVDGATLDDLLAKRVRLPAATAVGIVRHVANGLQEAARLGIVHKDVKPANILIARDGAVKLTDFGVAVLSDRVLGERLSIRSDSNTICGTVYYMPPEQAQGDEVDSRADMYALGVTLYQAVTGKLPFIGKTTAHVLLKQLRVPPIPPSDLVPGLPKIVSNTILKMMSRMASDRYKNYAELLHALDQCEAAVARRGLPASVPTWSAEAQAAAPPAPVDAEPSGSIWNWLKRGAIWLLGR